LQVQRPGRPIERIVRRALIRPIRIALTTSEPSPPRPVSPLVLFYPYIVLIFIGTGFLMLPAARSGDGFAPFMKAFFTSASAVTVTGLSTVDTSSYWTGFGQGVVLALVQIGGIGIIVYSTLLFIVIGRRIGLRERLAIHEAAGTPTVGGVVRLMRRVAVVVFIIEAIGVAALTARFAFDFDSVGEALWQGVFHTVAAFNNAGFSILPGGKGLEIYQHDAPVLLIVAALVILGGISIAVMSDVVSQRRFGRLSLDTKLVLTVTLALLAVGMLVFLVSEYSNPQTLGGLSWPAKLLDSFFESVVARTAGFASVPGAAWRDYTLFIFVLLMFIGAGAGSTAGGIKVNTFGVILTSVTASLRGRPRAEVFRREISEDQVSRALALGFVSLAAIFLVVFALTILEDKPFINLLFETTSAFGTVGKTAGVTPDLTTGGQLLIILMMVVGKAGPLTLMLALTQRAEPARIRYAEERVRIG